MIHLGDLCTLDRCKRSKNEHGGVPHNKKRKWLEAKLPGSMFSSFAFVHLAESSGGILHELREWCFLHTLQGINISHLGKRKIISKMPFFGDMLVPWRVSHGDRFHDSHQLLVFLPLISLPQSMEHSPSLSLRSLECWHNNNLLLFPCQFPLTKNYLGDFGLGIWPGLEDPWWLLKEFNKDGPSAWQLPSSHCSSISRDKDGCTPAPVYPWYLLCSLGDSWGL